MKQSKKKVKKLSKSKTRKSPKLKESTTHPEKLIKTDLHQGKSWNFRIPGRKRRFHKLPE